MQRKQRLPHEDDDLGNGLDATSGDHSGRRVDAADLASERTTSIDIVVEDRATELSSDLKTKTMDQQQPQRRLILDQKRMFVELDATTNNEWLPSARLALDEDEAVEGDVRRDFVGSAQPADSQGSGEEDESISDSSIGIPAISNNDYDEDEDEDRNGNMCSDQNRRVSTPAAIGMSTGKSTRANEFAVRCIWRRAATTLDGGCFLGGCTGSTRPTNDNSDTLDDRPLLRACGDTKLERLITPTRRSCSEANEGGANQGASSKMSSVPQMAPVAPDFETLMVESWLDDHPSFVRDYFLRKASRQVVDEWLIGHATKVSSSSTNLSSCNDPSQRLRSSITNTPITRPLVTPITSLEADFLPGDLNDQKSAQVRPPSPRPQLENQPKSADSVAIQTQSALLVGNRSGVRQIRSNSQSGSRASISSRLELQAMTPVRKISATDFESRTMNGYLRPMLSRTPDGRLTFLSQPTIDEPTASLSLSKSRTNRTRNDSAAGVINSPKLADDLSEVVASEVAATQQKCHLVERKIDLIKSEESSKDTSDVNNKNDYDKQSDTKTLNECDRATLAAKVVCDEDEFAGSSSELKLIFELVKNICDDLDIKTLLHKIMKNIAILINADKSSLSLVRGAPGDPNRHLVTQLFNVDQNDTINETKRSTRRLDGAENVCESGNNDEDDDDDSGGGGDDDDDGDDDVSDDDDYITIPWGTGLVGYVAQSGEFLNIADCYQDPRFTDAIDLHTGYLTKHMLCAPIYDKKNEIIGVAQVINKRNGQPFTKSDEVKFKRYLQFCGIGLRNAQSYEHCQLENRRNQVLLDLARMVFEEQSSVEQMVHRIMLHTQSLLECQRCQVLLIDDGSEDLEQMLQPQGCSGRANDDSATLSTSSQVSALEQQQQQQPQQQLQQQQDQQEQPTAEPSNNCDGYSSKLFSLVFDLECDSSSQVDGQSPCNLASGDQTHLSDQTRRPRPFPINIGITGLVAMTGQTLNIEDAHRDPRFDPSVDEGSDFRHKSILCMPIRNGQRKIIGVSQLVNKKNGRAFNKNDEDILEAFAIFCGLGIHNTLMYERVLKIMAKQRVTFEVLSYHATAPLEEAKKLNQEQIPSCFALNLASLKFNDFSLDDQYMLKSCLRFFLDLDLMRRFQIDQLVFCNWILSVQKNYRKVTYHPIVGKCYSHRSLRRAQHSLRAI